MRKIGTRPQRTIRRSAEVSGIGFLTGADVTVRFLPAPPSTGVVFARVDLPGKPRIAALANAVTGTQRRTTLGQGPNQVTLVEHTLAALAGLRIDNCLVEINRVEPPGLDGSSHAFVEALLAAGVETQDAVRPVYVVDQAVTVRAGNATLTLHPPRANDTSLSLSYFLDYGPTAPIVRQVATHHLMPGPFAREIANCRTFLLESEADELRRQGLGSRTTPADLLVFGSRGPIDNRLRFGNEPTRHKILDMVGDLSLFGADIRGHVIAFRSGHPLNVELARVLHQRIQAEPMLVADKAA